MLLRVILSKFTKRPQMRTLLCEFILNMAVLKFIMAQTAVYAMIQRYSEQMQHMYYTCFVHKNSQFWNLRPSLLVNEVIKEQVQTKQLGSRSVTKVLNPDIQTGKHIKSLFCFVIFKESGSALKEWISKKIQSGRLIVICRTYLHKERYLDASMSSWSSTAPRHVGHTKRLLNCLLLFRETFALHQLDCFSHVRREQSQSKWLSDCGPQPSDGRTSVVTNGTVRLFVGPPLNYIYIYIYIYIIFPCPTRKL